MEVADIYKSMNLYTKEFIKQALFNGSYSGVTVQNVQPYSFMSAEVAVGEYTTPPANENTVYFGYLKKPSGTVPTLVAKGAMLPLANSEGSTLVFFEYLQGDIGDNVDSPVQFYGFRVTVIAYSI